MAPVQALSPSPSVIVLLTPGLSLRELTNLSAVQQMRGASLGVMPTRLSVGASPPTLEEACRALGRGSRSPQAQNDALSTTLERNAHLRIVALDTAAAVLVGGTPPPREVARLQLPDGPEEGATNTELLAASVHQSLAAPAESRTVIAATFADLLRADQGASLALPSAARKQRDASLRRLDDLLRRLTKLQQNQEASLLLVTPLPSADAVARRERLGPLLLWQTGTKEGGGGLLTSPATRHTPGLIAASDVAATIAALAGLSLQDQRIGAGRAAVRLVSDMPLTYLQNRVDGWAFQSRAQQGLVWVPWVLASALVLGVWLREKRWGPALLVGAAAVPLALVAAPVLVPSRPGFEPVVFAVAGLFVALIGALAVAWRAASRRIFTAVCTVTMLLLVGDTLWGGPLLSRSPFSYSVIEAARFYGIGNEVSGVLIGTAIVSLLLWGVSFPTTGLLAACLCLVFALPTLGADAGGVAAVLGAFGALCVLRTPPRLRGRAVWATLLLIALLLAGYALWEGGRSAQSRTHVGEAVAAARTRGVSALSEIAARKGAVNVRLLFTSPWAALLLAEVSILVFFRRRMPLLPAEERFVLQTVFVAGGALFLLNDSGVVAAATCLLVAPPLLLLTESNDAEPAAESKPEQK